MLLNNSFLIFLMLKEKDLILIKHLRQNSRKSLANISRETNIPISTLFDRLNELEKTVIKNHVSLIDFSKLGYNFMVNFSIKTREKETLKNFLLVNKNVNSFYKVSPNFDFYIECVFKDMKELEDFKDNIKKFDIVDLNEINIVNDIKKEGFIL
jgi:DNA-binding Lrp family transcriptional regulator